MQIRKVNEEGLRFSRFRLRAQQNLGEERNQGGKKLY